MPYVSDRQRKFMHASKPEIAAKWDVKYGGRVSSKRDFGKPTGKRAFRKRGVR